MSGHGFRLFVVTLALLFGGHAAALAQAPAPSPVPPGMTQDQFNAMVDAIANSVAQKLKVDSPAAEPAPSAAPSATPSSPAKPEAKPAAKSKPPAPSVQIRKIEPSEGPDKFAVFLGQAKHVFAAVPVLGEHLATIPGLLDASDRGGRSSTAFLSLLAIAAILAVAAETVLQRLLAPLRQRVAIGAVPELGLRSMINLGTLAALDGLGLLVVWLICRGAIGAGFSEGFDQNKLAVAVLTGIFEWRLLVFAFRIVLRPGLPTARLCAVEDGPARSLYARISVLMLFVIFGHMLFLVLEAIKTPLPALSAYQVFSSTLFVVLFFWLASRSRDGIRQWFGGLARVARWAGLIERNWTGVSTVFILALGGTAIYGAISGQTYIAQAMMLTFNLVVSFLMFETFLQALVRRLDSQLGGYTPAGNAPKLPDVVARCLRVAVLIAVVVTIIERWVVQVFRLVDEDRWDQITASSRTAAITLFLAFVLWELFKYATQPYMDKPVVPGAAATADDGPPPTASRLSTLMPLLRITVAIVICLLAVLISLDDFGVNIAPLIAGASVFGLAISFGSQTLVKDIVSGIFYLSDDAFRVGEYIDCGKAKGTVEGFTLRSLKLRHQNGPIHTIPFGQLGQITNYSRDWTTVKFNLRFARDTNLEALRKAAKKIGTAIQEMPEFKDEVIEPFKMQGVADVLDNAFVVRFKFTAKPGNPTLIQKEAMKRMFADFPALGIEFAREGAPVVVHAASMPGVLPAPAAPLAEAPPAPPHPVAAQ